MDDFFDYIAAQSDRLVLMGRVRTAETYVAALRSLRRFCGSGKLSFSLLDVDFMQHYEAHLHRTGLSRNSSSFYMRILRRIYNRAVEEGLAADRDPFRRVYTGIDKTPKRAIPLHVLRCIKELHLASDPSLAYARDMFLFSFYMRGMSFVDMAYLRKCDLRNGFVTYNRCKTGQQLLIRWEPAMQSLLDRLPPSHTQFLLPIIQREDGTERRQYLNKLLYVNRKLKVIGTMAHVSVPLTMYVARHSWASIAHSSDVPLSVISEAMGHSSETTTRIYLASIQNSRVDEANSQIIASL